MSEGKIKPCKICGARCVIVRIKELGKPGIAFYKAECANGCIDTDNVKRYETAVKLWNEWN